MKRRPEERRDDLEGRGTAGRAGGPPKTRPMELSSLVALCVLAITCELPVPAHAQRDASAGQAPSVTRRFALAIGANDGGKRRARLRYAVSDARAFVRVMAQLGGVARGDRTMLDQPAPADIDRALAALRARMESARQAGERVEFIFYYSGHSDEQGLRLRETLMTYRDVRRRIDALPADVRIGVLDSCASGALTRLKGGQHRPPFLVDVSSQVRGHAFLTSSSESEAAQESDRIGASFFTHYLVSGLRGAADTSGDGRVTLSEAYRFAFDETLARTEATQGGAQHPAYEIQLAGTGDVVMTDLRETSATLSIDAAIEGRLFIRDAEGRLAAELYKPRGRAVSLGLSPGRYQVTVERPASRARATIELARHAQTELSRDQLVAESRELARARGAQPATTAVAPEDLGYRVIPFSMGLFYPVDTNAIEDSRKVVNRLSVNWIYGRAAIAHGVQIGTGVHHLTEHLYGVQLAAAGGLVEGRMQGGQLSAGFNYIDLEGEGLQATAGFNGARGGLEGAQLSAGVNYAGQHMRGAQLTAGVNLSRKLVGLQASAGLNATKYAEGAQLGTVNLADQIYGFQLAIVNVGGRVHGLQLGLLNLAEEADAQVGLLSFSRRHGAGFQAWSSDTALLSVAARLEAGRSYGLVVGALHPLGGDAGYALGVGVGFKIPMSLRLHIDVDETFYTVQYDYEGIPFDGHRAKLAQTRMLMRVKLTSFVDLFAGPTINVLFAPDADDHGRRPGYDYHVHRSRSGGTEVTLWPGLAAGIFLN